MSKPTSPYCTGCGRFCKWEGYAWACGQCGREYDDPPPKYAAESTRPIEPGKP